MVDKKFTIEHGKVWQRPDQAYADFQDAAKDLNPTELADGKHKLLQEKRDVAFWSVHLRFDRPTYICADE